MDKEANLLPVGTRLSGYAQPKLGPFKCSNCVHFDNSPVFHCEHPAVKADFDVLKDSSGRALVAPEGCCTYFRKN
jgi:hypothetical protein